MTLVSLAVGVLAAAAFATGERAGLVAGAMLLQAAFTLDCVDGQLARYTRQFSKLGAWLDSIFDRTKEYVVFAGLAIGASRTGDPVWLLAGAALTLQTARHAIDFSYPAAQHQVIAAAPQPPLEDPLDGPRRRVPAHAAGRRGGGGLAAAPPPPRARADHDQRGGWCRCGARPTASRRVRWVKKIIAFPIGERFAAISLTAALFSAHTTFVVLLVVGRLRGGLRPRGRTLRSLTA